MAEPKRVSTEAKVQLRLRDAAEEVGARVELPHVSTRSMLEGLATVHPIVLVVDADLRVSWLHDDVGIVEGGADTAVGDSVSALLDGLWPDDIAAFGEQTRRFFGEMIERDRVTRARFDLRRDGRPLSLEVSAFHARDAIGNDFVVCVADRHRSLDSLERKNEELESCIRSVSHDLRSPLVALLGFSRLLRDDYAEVLDGTGLHFLDRIEQAGRNMERLLNDMLEISRIGATPQHRVDVNPLPILEQLKAELKLQLDAKHIQLHLPVDPPSLLCDRTRLYQLLSNLIGNAIHHMQDDRSGRIEVGFETLPDGWQIMVADNGPGIAPEDHERIFEVFQTAGTPHQGKKSSGLGLAIVKKIVEAHSGRVWVESEQGSGTRFFVWLPKG